MTENNQTVNNRYETDSLAGKLRSFVMKEGENKTPVPYLNLYRFTEEQDCEIAEYVVSVFERETRREE